MNKRVRVGQNSNSYWTYEGFLPSRIVNRITEIINKFNDPSKLSFDIISFYGWDAFSEKTIKEKIDIFFLKIGILNSRQEVVIDAWRGPTFSDEESYLP